MTKKLSFGALAVLMLLGLYFYLSSVWRDPRAATEYISDLRIPASAELVEERGDDSEHFFTWRVDSLFLDSLIQPDGRRIPHSREPGWQPFALDFFGVLQATDLPDDAEALYYATSFWSVALIRSKAESTLTVAGIYTN